VLRAYYQAKSRDNIQKESQNAMARNPQTLSPAMAVARSHQGEAPERELYVFHTNRETLDIAERRWLGIRGAQ
jgi:hypothetical protein